MIKSTLKVRMAERDLTFKALAQQTRDYAAHALPYGQQ